MTDTIEESTPFARAWGEWERARVDGSLAPLGTASLVATNWLTSEPHEIAGFPGLWHIDGDRIVGTGLVDTPLGRSADERESRDTWTLEPRAELTDGRRVIRSFVRGGGEVALRVLDPDSDTRAAIDDIAAWDPSEEWAIAGNFRPAAGGDTVAVTSVDGVTVDSPYAGVIELQLPGGSSVELTVSGDGDGFFAVFGDTTNGVESYRFRFLDIGAPDAEGQVVVDFNRAYLPPCSFSDHYVCPLPGPGNRLPEAVRAGERAVVLHGRESIAGIHAA